QKREAERSESRIEDSVVRRRQLESGRSWQRRPGQCNDETKTPPGDARRGVFVLEPSGTRGSGGKRAYRVNQYAYAAC
ncbi:MAG: hypothetical protein Q8N20_04410, partial [Eubacteriales bacterium]|nr:hypothetical protein [Eubacteriales bacterium]